MSLLCLALLAAGLVQRAAAQAILLPRTLPSFNQTYTVGSGAWGEVPLGTGGCPDVLRTTGCLITAFASVLAYFEIDLVVPAASSSTGTLQVGMNPRVLNDWLRARRGYGQCAGDPVGACCLEWSALPRGVTLTFHANRNNVGLNPVAELVIDHALRQGHPVVAGVHWAAACRRGSSQTEDCHWVILTGKVGDTYTIVDPYNPDRTNPAGVRTTLDAGSLGAYTIDRFAVVAPTPGDASSLNSLPDVASPPAPTPAAPTPTPPVSTSPLASLLVLLVALSIVAGAIFLSADGQP